MRPMEGNVDPPHPLPPSPSSTRHRLFLVFGRQLFGVEGIPSLVLLDPAGKLVTKEGDEAVRRASAPCLSLDSTCFS